MIRFVLLRPRFGENVGAAARALKNMGLSQWTLVDSQVQDLAAAERMAVQADDVLAGRREVATLDEAVRECAWVVGTSSRKVKGKRRLSPREFAAEALTRGEVALVFGDERSGMTNEEVDRCHDLSAVPTDDAQPSINLAQSVLLYAWEVRMASLLRSETPAAPRAAAATDEAISRLQVALKELLAAGGFLQDEGRPAVKQLMAPLVRSQLTKAEAQLWMAAVKSLTKGLR